MKGMTPRHSGHTIHLALATVFVLAGSGCQGWSQLASVGPHDPIKTDLGLVSGLVVGEAGREVRSYRGIPYAAPPVGDLRWRAPRPAVPWKGVRQSTEYSAACAQYVQSDLRKVDSSKVSEDCLYLNVNTPAKAAGDKLPVMMWLHGGGLDASTGNLDLYNGPALPQHGVVTVTVNHRLGAFSLFTYPELAEESPHNAAGNYGLLDLVAALQWVQRNIAQFGGDPDRVTIFGEGGGAQKVLWLLSSPLVKGLFQRAILEAGTSRGIDDNNTRTDTEEQAYLVSRKMVDQLHADTLEQLRAKSWQEIVQAMPQPPAGAEVVPARDSRMHPAIDDWSLLDHPVNILDERLGSDVPVLVGGDAGESAVFEGYVADWLPALSHRNSNLYVYRFTHVPANWRKAGVVAPHGLEVPYQFGELKGKWTMFPGLAADPGLNKEDSAVAEDVMKMWVQFAATGDPSVDGLIRWPAFKPADGQDKYVEVGTKPEVKSAFLSTFKEGAAGAK